MHNSSIFYGSYFLDLNNKTNFEEFESVHLSNFPVANKDLIDKDLEKNEMAFK